VQSQRKSLPSPFAPDKAYYSSIEYVAMATPTTSVVDDAIAYQPEFEDDIETISDYGHELEDQDISFPTRDVANDSDVVEVVKLRRHDRHHAPAEPETFQQPSQTKRPNSLKSRASRAFKSLTGSLRSKSRTQDTISSSSSRSSSQNERDAAQSHQDPAPPTSRSRTPTALRRGSGVLSQLFTTPIKTRSSVGSFDETALASPTSPTHPKYSISESSSSVQNKHLSSSSSSYETSLQDQARLEAASPSPTTTSRKSSRRFSILSLQKLFSFGSATPVTAEEAEDKNLANNVQPEEPDITTATPVLRSVPSTPAFSSSSSNSGPETPTSSHYQIPVRLVTSSSSMDGAPDFPAFDTLDTLFDSNQNLNLGLGLGLNLPASGSSGRPAEPSTPRKSFSPSSTMWGSITPKGRKKSTLPSNEADTSLEIHLDSLHFDSLSFDIDRFSLK
jgi:hypothetical protein